MVDYEFKQNYGFEDLLAIMAILRAPGGCPWDREQTHASIKQSFIEETYEAGMVLLGSEIKSLRKGKVSLKEAYVSFVDSEAFVKGMHIASYKDATYNDHDETRDRKLLLHKKEIDRLFSKCRMP